MQKEEQHVENEQDVSNVVTCVREFVVQQLQGGVEAGGLSFALALIATELGLHMTHERNQLAAVRIALQGVMTAAAAFSTQGPSDAPAEIDATPRAENDSVPHGTVLH